MIQQRESKEEVLFKDKSIRSTVDVIELHVKMAKQVHASELYDTHINERMIGGVFDFLHLN